MADQHTPGPWKAREYKNHEGDIWIDCKAYANGGKGRQLGGTIAVAFHTGTGKGSMEANARLIAAAPELLEACGQAIALIEGWDAGATEADVRRVMGVINSALAKAMGEPAPTTERR